jgi:ferrous iron transport protein A
LTYGRDRIAPDNQSQLRRPLPCRRFSRPSSNVRPSLQRHQAQRGPVGRSRRHHLKVGTHCHHKGEETVELERRLLELGFVEGARIELIHRGPVRPRPIAVKVDDMRVALRRNEAASLTFRSIAEAAE